jgi:hypothetical protein
LSAPAHKISLPRAKPLEKNRFQPASHSQRSVIGAKNGGARKLRLPAPSWCSLGRKCCPFPDSPDISLSLAPNHLNHFRHLDFLQSFAQRRRAQDSIIVPIPTFCPFCNKNLDAFLASKTATLLPFVEAVGLDRPSPRLERIAERGLHIRWYDNRGKILCETLKRERNLASREDILVVNLSRKRRQWLEFHNSCLVLLAGSSVKRENTIVEFVSGLILR